MKQIYRLVFSFFLKLYFKLLYIYGDNIFSGYFFLVKIILNGVGHSIQIKSAHISNTIITISGNNNQLMIENGVKLRNATIIIRGSNCSIKIGKGTTFGGVRIINVGDGNNISIGEDCLFSDHIEIWASDTHTILDNLGRCINPERPIVIGNNVWVGSKVTILKGVTINNGSIIGMGSTVTKDVPANVISVGSPSKTIKEDISWVL